MVFVYVRLCLRVSVGYPKMLPVVLLLFFFTFNDIFALCKQKDSFFKVETTFPFAKENVSFSSRVRIPEGNKLSFRATDIPSKRTFGCP